MKSGLRQNTRNYRKRSTLVKRSNSIEKTNLIKAHSNKNSSKKYYTKFNSNHDSINELDGGNDLNFTEIGENDGRSLNFIKENDKIGSLKSSDNDIRLEKKYINILSNKNIKINEGKKNQKSNIPCVCMHCVVILSLMT